MRAALLIAAVSLAGALASDCLAQWRTGLRPTQHPYAALVYTALSLQGVYVVTLGVMGSFLLARSLFGRLDARRRASWDNTALLWHYTVAQGLLVVALLHLVPRWLP